MLNTIEEIIAEELALIDDWVPTHEEDPHTEPDAEWIMSVCEKHNVEVNEKHAEEIANSRWFENEVADAKYNWLEAKEEREDPYGSRGLRKSDFL